MRYRFSPPDENTEFYDHCNTIYLLCDSYPVQFSPEALKFAKLLIIVLIKIPGSTTDLFQAFLKNKARKYYNARIAREIIENLSIEEVLHQSVALPQIKLISKKDAVVILETYWEEIDEELIRQAWIDSVLKYFIYNQHKTEENYALDQNELQKLIDSDRFINDYNEEEEQENESEFSYDEANDETLPAIRNNTEMLAEYQSNNESQHESMIVNAVTIEVLMRIHFQYIIDFEKFYIYKKINDKQKTLQRQQKAISNLIAQYQLY